MKRKSCFLFVLILLLVCIPVQVRAQEKIFNQNRVVNEGQKVENIFLYGEDGVISGEVTDEVVVINGNLTLTKTARVKDMVFVVGGKLIQQPGASVGKGIFRVNLASENLNSIFLGAGAFVLIELVKFGLALLLFIFSLISIFVFRNRVNKAKELLKADIVKTGLLGVLATTGLSLIFAALAVTIWGIPVAILLGLIVLVLLPVGLGALSLITGELLLKGFDWGEKPFYQVLTGSLFMICLLNFPVLGLLWGLLLLIFALGTLSLSLLPGKKVGG